MESSNLGRGGSFSPEDIADWLRPFVESGATDFNLAAIAATDSERLAGVAEVRDLLLS